MSKQVEFVQEAELELTVEEMSSVAKTTELETDRPERHPCACCTCA